MAELGGLAVDNGDLVDATLRTLHLGVYAIADIAGHDHPILRRRVRVEHWDDAVEPAKVSAHNLLGEPEPYERQPHFFTDKYDLGMEYVGHVGPAGYDQLLIEGDTDSAFCTYWLRDDVVVAAMHANDRDASDEILSSVGQPRAQLD